MLKRLKITTLALCLLAPGLLMADDWAIFDRWEMNCYREGGCCQIIVVTP